MLESLPKLVHCDSEGSQPGK